MQSGLVACPAAWKDDGYRFPFHQIEHIRCALCHSPRTNRLRSPNFIDGAHRFTTDFEISFLAGNFPGVMSLLVVNRSSDLPDPTQPKHCTNNMQFSDGIFDGISWS